MQSTLDITNFRGPQKKFVVSRVRNIEGMPKAIVKEIGTSELVCYIKGTLYRKLTVLVCNVFWLTVALTVQVANFVLVCQKGGVIPLKGGHTIKQSADTLP